MPALVLFDYSMTLRREVALIWAKPFTLVRLLFHANRWILLLWATFSFHSTFFPEAENSTVSAAVLGFQALVE